MLQVDREKEFLLDSFIENIDTCSRASNSPPDEIYNAVVEIYEILFSRDLKGKYADIENDTLFDYFSKEEIEWFCDHLEFYPQSSAPETNSLNNIIIQHLMNNDIISSVSQTKPTRKKGFVFI